MLLWKMRTSFLIRPCTCQLEEARLPAQNGYTLINCCPCANARHIASIKVLVQDQTSQRPQDRKHDDSTGRGHPLARHINSASLGQPAQQGNSQTLHSNNNTKGEEGRKKHLQWCAKFLTPPTLLKSPPFN